MKTLDCSIEEFYRDVRDAQTDCSDVYLSTFIDCLLASADYESFYKVMSKEGAKSAAKRKTPSLAMKAEAKNSGGRGDEGGDGKRGPEDTSSADAKGGRSRNDSGDESDHKRSSHK